MNKEQGMSNDEGEGIFNIQCSVFSVHLKKVKCRLNPLLPRLRRAKNEKGAEIKSRVHY